MCRLSWNLGASTSWNPQGLSRPVMGLLYLFLLLTLTSTTTATTTNSSGSSSKQVVCINTSRCIFSCPLYVCYWTFHNRSYCSSVVRWLLSSTCTSQCLPRFADSRALLSKDAVNLWRASLCNPCRSISRTLPAVCCVAGKGLWHNLWVVDSGNTADNYVSLHVPTDHRGCTRCSLCPTGSNSPPAIVFVHPLTVDKLVEEFPTSWRTQSFLLAAVEPNINISNIILNGSSVNIVAVGWTIHCLILGRDETSRPVLRLTQPFTQWVPGFIPVGKATCLWRTRFTSI